jgi:hypothetical protein
MGQRFIPLAILLVALPSSASAQDVIKPGMKLNEVQSILKRHDYKFGNEYALAEIAEDRDSDLFFCQVDSYIVLVAVYKKSTGIVTSMSADFFPPRPAPKAERVVATRKVRKVVFDEDGAFTVSMERVFRKPIKDEKQTNPFGD